VHFLRRWRQAKDQTAGMFSVRVEEDPIRFMRDRVSSHLCGMFPRDDLVSLILKPNISEKIDPSFYAIPSLEQNTWYV
jgi:hypothetical protein